MLDGTLTPGGMTLARMSAEETVLQVTCFEPGATLNKVWKLKGTRRQLKPSSCEARARSVFV